MVLGFVVIGRNEGERLRDCLRSMASRSEPIVYVDSGSTDGSVELATSLGAVAVELDDSAPFTAARARNAGFAKLRQIAPGTTRVQFVDGDCEIVEGWIETAHAFLDTHPGVAVVCGGLRESYPDVSVYNRLCDKEWNSATGQIRSCGGVAMVRARALVQCGGYRENLMAGEEPELCLRLREDGWKVWRLEDDMAFHDAELTSFGQWWRRTKRGGYAYAEVSSLHIHSPERFWRKETFRAVFWAGILPILVFGGSFAHPLALSLGVLYPVQIARLAVREGDGKASWVYAHFMMLAKFAEFAGIVQFLWKSWFAKRSGLFAGIADNRKRLTDWRSR